MMSFRPALNRLCLMCYLANPGAKDALFRHWFPQHALSSIGFRCGACVDLNTIGAELTHILLIR